MARMYRFIWTGIPRKIVAGCMTRTLCPGQEPGPGSRDECVRRKENTLCPPFLNLSLFGSRYKCTHLVLAGLCCTDPSVPSRCSLSSPFTGPVLPQFGYVKTWHNYWSGGQRRGRDGSLAERHGLLHHLQTKMEQSFNKEDCIISTVQEGLEVCGVLMFSHAVNLNVPTSNLRTSFLPDQSPELGLVGSLWLKIHLP